MAVGFGEPVGVGGSVGVADAVGAVVGFSPVFPEFVAAGCALAIDFLFDTLLFIVIFFFCPTVNVIFVFANFAFAKTSAENDGLRADAKSAKDKLKQRNVFFMFQNPLSFLLENTF